MSFRKELETPIPTQEQINNDRADRVFSHDSYWCDAGDDLDFEQLRNCKTRNLEPVDWKVLQAMIDTVSVRKKGVVA